MWKKNLLWVLIAAMALMGCGCDYLTQSVKSLVAPPSLNTQQKYILQALDSSLQSNETITLDYPENGDNRSAILTCNIDEEPSDEAVVFYNSDLQSSLGKASSRICLLDQLENGWRAVWNLPGTGNSVDKVLFFTEPDTGQKLLLVGFQTEKQLQNNCVLYRYQNGVFSQMYTTPYQMLELFDINGDGQDELITMAYREESHKQTAIQSTQPTYAQMICYQSGNFAVADEVLSKGNALRYNNIIKDQTSFGKPALFLDEQISKNSYATEILTCENGKLQNLIVQQSVDLFDQTLRTQVPVCYDFNQDGVVEIPGTEFFPGYTENSESPLYLTKWYQLDGKRLKQVAISYVNYSQGYGYLLPNEWEGKVSARQNLQNDEISFFLYGNSLEQGGTTLLQIRSDTINNLRTEGTPAGYFSVHTIGQMVYLASHPTSLPPPYDLTNQQINNLFVEMHLSIQ